MNYKAAITACMAAMMISGCATKKITPLSVNTEQNAPVRLHVFEQPDPAHVNQILILPPLGIQDPTVRNNFQQSLYAAAQRRFKAPVKMVKADSAYSPYVTAENLLLSDGTINFDEVSIIGNLMNTSYIICPLISELRPYHPQRVDIRLVVVDAAQTKSCVELTGTIDAQDNDTVAYFKQFSAARKNQTESNDDLSFRIKSPAAFQSFIADLCASAMADNLPF